MEVNDDHIDNGFDDDKDSPWYYPPWMIYNVNHAMEDVTAEEINDFYLGKRDDIKVVEFDNEELRVLNSFGSFDFAFYAATNEHYCERHIFLESLRFEKGEKYLDVILVLLKYAFWGLPKDDFDKKDIQYIEDTNERIRSFHRMLPDIKALLQLLEAEKNLQDESKILPKYSLEKITFSFRDNHAPDKKNKKDKTDKTNKTIQIKTQPKERNPIGNFITSYYETIKNNRTKIYEDLGMSLLSKKIERDEVFCPYKLFCYRFVQFLEAKTTLNKKKLGSRNKQFIIYHILLQEAGYRINIQKVGFYNVEGYIKQWYDDGKILERIRLKDIN